MTLLSGLEDLGLGESLHCINKDMESALTALEQTGSRS